MQHPTIIQNKDFLGYLHIGRAILRAWHMRCPLIRHLSMTGLFGKQLFLMLPRWKSSSFAPYTRKHCRHPIASALLGVVCRVLNYMLAFGNFKSIFAAKLCCLACLVRLTPQHRFSVPHYIDKYQTTSFRNFGNFFISKFDLEEVFFVSKLGLVPSPKFPLSQFCNRTLENKTMRILS